MYLKDLPLFLIAKKVVIKTYKIANILPSNEQYVIVDQIKRASLSVLTNISESEGVYTIKARLKYLYIARGSLSELKGCLYLIDELYTINETQILRDITKLEIMLNKNIKMLPDNLKQ